MARPGFVLEVDERTPPLTVRSGADILRERFPLGTQVVYPPDPVRPLDDLDETIDQALAAPLDSAPLAERLRPGMRLTLTVSDATVPLPRMRRPDIRARLAEHVLTVAAAAGVDDVEVIAATGLHRRLTEDELEWILGERVVRSFADGHLTSHDAEDPEQLVSLGTTADGVPVEVNRRVAESDLVVHLAALTSPGEPSGWDGLLAGLGSARTLAARFGLDGARHRDGLAAVVAERLPVLMVGAVLNTDMYPPVAQLFSRREWEWSVRDQATFVALRRALAFTPHRTRQLLFTTPAPYGVIAVAAGDPAAVAARTGEALAAQHTVEVDGQADVLITGVGQLSPHTVGASPNPLVAAAGAAEAYARHTGERPAVRPGGALIIYHPAAPTDSGREQPSTPDFLTDVLSRTTDPQRIAAEFEPRFAADPWYRHLYRDAHAYHALQPMHLWYALTSIRTELADVVWVGADRPAVEQLGFRVASTLADALEMVSTHVGRSPALRYLHTPPYPWIDAR